MSAMKYEDLLQLLYSAPDRYNTAFATLHEWRTGWLRAKAYTQWVEGRSSNGMQTPSFMQYADANQLHKIWVEMPNRWRQETPLPDGVGTSCRIVDDDRAEWIYDPLKGFMGSTREDAPPHREFSLEPDIIHLFKPEAIQPEIEEIEMSLVEEQRFAGHDALRVVATARRWLKPPFPLPEGADDYEFIIDANRGVILRSVARLDGMEFAGLEMSEIAFDRTFDEETFVPRLKSA